jgi:Carbohydrate family 9 binding domain-like
MRGLIQGGGAAKRGRDENRPARMFGRYGSALSLLGVIAAGCAAQDANDALPGGGSSDAGSSSAGSSGSTSAGTSAGTGINTAGSTNGGSANGGSTNGGSTNAGAGGNQSGSSNGGTATGGGAGGSGGVTSGGKGGTAGSSSGGSGGSGGNAGTGGKGGAGGSAGSAGSAGMAGSAGSGGGPQSCSVVTDCATQSVCEASKCRARGCNATNCAYDLTRFILGTPVAASARGQVFVTWDATKLDLDFQILDKTAQNDSADNWDDDSVEIYLDLNHAKATAYDGDDFQIMIPRDAGTTIGIGPNINFGSIVVTRIENANGYELKVALPWNALNGAGSQVGKTIGFDVGLNDDRDGAGRETQVMLYGFDQNYLNTSQFGNLTLAP